MIIAGPRSATTWASNWLCTDTTLCIHDPLAVYRPEELDDIESEKLLGISCTALFLYPDFLNAHPARKVILHRPQKEIDASLVSIGLTPMPLDIEYHLNKIEGIHMDWLSVFDKPREIYEFLLEKEFDEERHELLKQIEIQPHFPGVDFNPNRAIQLASRLQELSAQMIKSMH